MSTQSVINCDLNHDQISESNSESTLLEKEMQNKDVFDFRYVFPKCGKEFLRLCAIPADAVKRTVVTENINPSVCASKTCPVYLKALTKAESIIKAYGHRYTGYKDLSAAMDSILKEQLSTTCISSDLTPCCAHGAIEVKEEVVYDYEFAQCKGKPRKLSKVQIKLALIYHFLSDNNGFIPRVSDLDLATKIGCDIKTLRSAIEVLADLGIIAYSTIDTYNKSVCILDFKKYHLPARKGGSGYIVMAPTTLEALLECTDINELRAQIRKLLIDDKNNITNDNEGKEVRSTSVLSINDARRFSARYLTKSKIKKLFTTSALFDGEEAESKVSFKLKDMFNGKRARANALGQLKESVQGLVAKYNFSLEEEEEYDAAQLAKEYGLTVVQEAFNNIATTISNEEVKKDGLLKDLLNKYDALVGKDSSATAIFNELVDIFESKIGINEAVVLKEKHPEVIVKGKTAIQNFGGYLRTTIKSILHKKRDMALV